MRKVSRVLTCRFSSSLFSVSSGQPTTTNNRKGKVVAQRLTRWTWVWEAWIWNYPDYCFMFFGLKNPMRGLADIWILRLETESSVKVIQISIRPKCSIWCNVSFQLHATAVLFNSLSTDRPTFNLILFQRKRVCDLTKAWLCYWWYCETWKYTS